MAEDFDLRVDGQGTEDQSTAEDYGAPDLLEDQGVEQPEGEGDVQSEEEDTVDPFDPFDEALETQLKYEPERGIAALRERWQKAELGRKKAFTKRMQKISNKENEIQSKLKNVEGFLAKAKEVDPLAFDRVVAAGTGRAAPTAQPDPLANVNSKADLARWMDERISSVKEELFSQYQGDQLTKQVDAFLQRNGSFKQHREKIVGLCRTAGLTPSQAAAACDPRLVVKLARDSVMAGEPSGDTGVNEATAPRKTRYTEFEDAWAAAQAAPRPASRD